MCHFKWRPPMSMQFWSLSRKFTIALSTISCGIALISWVIAAFSSKFASRCWYTCNLTCPHKKKSQGVKSGERGGHPISPPRRETRWPGNMSWRIPSERWEECDVAPSCWNHTSSGLWSASNRIIFGRRNLEHFTIMV